MSERRGLALIVLLAVSLRVILALLRGPGFTPLLDEQAYHRLALGLLEGRGLSAERDLGPIAVAGSPTSVWNCGQPLYLAGLYALWGVRPLGVFVVNALLGGVLVALCGRLARRVVTARAALLAALVMAVNPYSIHLSASLYAEPLYMTLLTGALVLLMPEEPDLGVGRAAGAGVLLGLAALLRSTAFYFLPFALLGLAARFRRRAWLPALVLSGAALLVISPWVARNTRVHGGFVFLDTKAGWNLYTNYHPTAERPPERHGHPYIPMPKGYEQLAERERDRLLGRLGLGFIRDRPLGSLRRALEHLAAFWSPLVSEQTRASARIAKPLFLVPLELLAVAGALAVWGRRRRLGLLYLLVLYYSLLHSVMIGAPRYRHALDPVLAVFAAASLERLFRRDRAAPLETGSAGARPVS